MIPDLPFINPFRYQPHPLVRKAAESVISEIDGSESLSALFAEGKMLGVLIVQDKEGQIFHLKGFSGTVGGKACLEGFVPPIFDLTESGGFYKTKEAEISLINQEIENIQILESEPMERFLENSYKEMEQELILLKSKKREAGNIAESQFANGEIKRAKDRWKVIISQKKEELLEIKDRITTLKKQRALMSDNLQRWIFGQYIVHNAKGEKLSILDIFINQGLMPPGGTGDCAAPKLLNHAFRNGLKPVAMGEFWYGKSPGTAVRTHGHFYPSCTSKCGPLLEYMLSGLETDEGWGDLYARTQKIEIIYEDEDIVVANKPSGMPSVPGLDGKQSLQEWLHHKLSIKIFPTHRLDMDTSGVILYAKTSEAEVNLKKQFEEHTVKKTYIARLSPIDTHRFASEIPVLKPGDKGTIELPLSPDYDERPRQKVDKVQGKPSLTEYEVLSICEDGTTDIAFHPHTGRTHQLRVHSAHLLGLGRPILGDRLYGGCGTSQNDPRAANLCLHALRITFRHPSTGEEITLQA